MNIVIIGAGVVGTSLAMQLSQEGHSVAIIDRDFKIITKVRDTMDVLAIHGSGTLPSVLEKAGIRRAHMVIAVTTSDEVNLVAGILANGYNIQHRIVRIRNPEYAQEGGALSLSRLGIQHVVNPEPHIVESLVRMIDLPGAYDVATLAGGQVQMFGFHISNDSPAIGRTLAELRELGSLNAFLILYITRQGEVIVPGGQDSIQPGDSVHLLVSSDTVEFLRPILHPSHEMTRSVVIVGASRVAVQLAAILEGRLSVTLIEADAILAEDAAKRLRKTNVLVGDGADVALLEEAAIDHCDLFCALSEDGHRNVLASLLAKKHGAIRTAALVFDPEYASILDSLGVDIVINPRLVVVGEILQHLRRGHIFSVTRVAEGQGEIIEMEVPEGCMAIEAPLKRLKFPKNALVGAIVSGGEMQLPTGDTQICAGDRVLLYALPQAIPKIEKLFEKRH
ncbi:MAG: Trk system potassium transporter TrkA [Myxococcota bacterium]